MLPVFHEGEGSLYSGEPPTDFALAVGYSGGRFI